MFSICETHSLNPIYQHLQDFDLCDAVSLLQIKEAIDDDITSLDYSPQKRLLRSTDSLMSSQFVLLESIHEKPCSDNSYIVSNS